LKIYRQVIDIFLYDEIGKVGASDELVNREREMREICLKVEIKSGWTPGIRI